MEPRDVERRLTTILTADVVGYSRLMAADEAGTLAALKSHRMELFDPKAAQYHGRTIKLMGDGTLMEFASVVDAVAFAVEIQCAMAERDANVPEDRRITYRIGINIGDIITDGDDIYGDGVNIAARLEGLADPGGVCIARNVFNQVKGKLDLTFEHLGEKEVKNIPEPVMVYRVVFDEKAAALVTPVTQDVAKRERRWWPMAAATAAVLVLAVGGALWWQPWAPDVEPASVERMDFPLPDKPSIAVLPFDNMSGNPAQGYFADGVTESIIAELSRDRALFVIARNSTFTYKGKPVEVRQVAEELGVRYVLEGSVQQAGDTIRITAQLIDATTGAHVWAERYDGEAENLFALQDQIVRRIVATLRGYKGAVQQAEYERTLRKLPEDMSAYDYVTRGIVHKDRFTRADNLIAIELFEKAIALDPNFALPYGWLAWAQAIEVFMGWSETPEETIALAFESAQKAIALDPTLDIGRWALGGAYLAVGDAAQGLVEMERALELNLNNADILADMAWPLTYLGRAEEGIAHVEQAMRLNPHFPEWYLWGLGTAQYFAGRYTHAIASFNRMSHHNIHSRLLLAASYAQGDQGTRAQAEIAEALTLEPNASLSATQVWRPVFAREEDFTHFIDGLAKAGLPEHPPLQLPDKPSIAVLPFNNMSDDSSQEYFADGMTEDLITDLSKISGLFVIARNSSFTYKGKTADVKQVARELGVRYLLEGSVRRAGNEVRINAQLIDATTGGHLWAERYDGTIADVFALQDRISGNIVAALALQLTAAEAEQAAVQETKSIEAYDNFLRGWAHFRQGGPDGFADAIGSFEKAVDLDPDYARAHAAMALAYFIAGERGFEEAFGIPFRETRHRARSHLKLAMQSPTSLAHRAASVMTLKQRLYGEAVAHAERAVALDPSDAGARANLAYTLFYDNQLDAAISAAEMALRLDPNNPALALQWIGRAEFAKGDFHGALKFTERARKHRPTLASALFLAAIQAHLGRLEEAKSNLEVYTSAWSSPPSLAEVMFYWPYKDSTVAERFTEGLLKAGLSGPPGGYYIVSEADRLDGDEVKTLLFGREIAGVDLGWGDRWTQVRGLDGTATCTETADADDHDFCAWRGPSDDPGSARGWIDGDMLCEKVKVREQFYETCFPVFRNPKGKSELMDEFLAVTDVGLYPFSPVN